MMANDVERVTLNSLSFSQLSTYNLEKSVKALMLKPRFWFIVSIATSFLERDHKENRNEAILHSKPKQTRLFSINNKIHS